MRSADSASSAFNFNSTAACHRRRRRAGDRAARGSSRDRPPAIPVSPATTTRNELVRQTLDAEVDQRHGTERLDDVDAPDAVTFAVGYQLDVVRTDA